MSLPPYIGVDEIRRRLPLIFPPGSPGADFCTRDIAGSVVFAFLYTGAIDGTSRWCGPKQVYRMSDEQAALTSDAERLNYATDSTKAGFKERGKAWYADTTREPIRDEVIRQGLLVVDAVKQNQAIATTSSKPRYCLTKGFAALFDPTTTGTALDDAISKWQRVHFDAGHTARIKLVRDGAGGGTEQVLITFPNKESRLVSPGESSMIAKGLIEEFAPRFLERPAVVLLSDTKRKVISKDDETAKAIGLTIDPQRTLPDIVLADLRADSADPPILVFAEVVASDGPITQQRRDNLLAVAPQFPPERIAFVTAFLDRSRAPARKLFHSIAWNTFAWYAAEPASIIALHNTDTTQLRLHTMLRFTKPE